MEYPNISIQGKKSSINQKKNKKLFYDSKWQSEQAKKAGLQNTEKQQKMASKWLPLLLTFGFPCRENVYEKALRGKSYKYSSVCISKNLF